MREEKKDQRKGKRLEKKADRLDIRERLKHSFVATCSLLIVHSICNGSPICVSVYLLPIGRISSSF